MGYNIDKIEVNLRLDNHLGPQTKADEDAARNLRMEIEALIASSPEYQLIVTYVWGGDGS